MAFPFIIKLNIIEIITGTYNETASTMDTAKLKTIEILQFRQMIS